jgi:hypothetical protein
MRKPRLPLLPRPMLMLLPPLTERLSERPRGRPKSRLLESESKPKRNEKEGVRSVRRRPLSVPRLLLLPAQPLPLHPPKVVVVDSSSLPGVSPCPLRKLLLLELSPSPLRLPLQFDLPLLRPVRGLPGVLPPLRNDLLPMELPHQPDLPGSAAVVRGESDRLPRRLLLLPAAEHLRTLLLRLLPVGTSLPLEGRVRIYL